MQKKFPLLKVCRHLFRSLYSVRSRSCLHFIAIVCGGEAVTIFISRETKRINTRMKYLWSEYMNRRRIMFNGDERSVSRISQRAKGDCLSPLLMQLYLVCPWLVNFGSGKTGRSLRRIHVTAWKMTACGSIMPELQKLSLLISFVLLYFYQSRNKILLQHLVQFTVWMTRLRAL